MSNQLAMIVATLTGAGILGTAMPAAVAAVVQTHWASWAKALTALALSAIVGTATAWAGGQLAGLAWPAAIVVALGASQVTYTRWWKPTGIGAWIEDKTNLVRTIDGQAVVTAQQEIPPGGE